MTHEEAIATTMLVKRFNGKFKEMNAYSCMAIGSIPYDIHRELQSILEDGVNRLLKVVQNVEEQITENE